jgi:hypothetical protein
MPGKLKYFFYKFWEIAHKYTYKLINSYFYYISATHYCCKSSRVIIGQTHSNKISQQPENCENRNHPDLVQAFLKKWWVESDFKAPNLPLSLQLKVSGMCHNKISQSYSEIV